MIAIGMGLHNLGEGLAIGASYSMGAANPGTFLVIGFMLQLLPKIRALIALVLKERLGLPVWPGWDSSVMYRLL